jgi:nucleoside-diphosphate-sugar epimerase
MPSMRAEAGRVMVTGATGFIGCHCVQRLVAAGYEVHAVSSQSSSSAACAGIRWHRHDLHDPIACVAAIDAIRPTHLLHLAWIATPGVFWSSEANLAWLASGVRLIDEFYRRGGKRAVGAGTCAEYAWTAADSAEMETPLHPDTIYGRCKLALSLAFEAAAGVHGQSAAWARLFFPYGPGEPEARLIPAVIRALLRGEVVECTHGRQVRDFVFVDDVADALVALLANSAQGAFNIGSGTGNTLREVVDVIVSRLGHGELVRFGARAAPPGDPMRVVADVSRVGREIGWKPRVGIEEGIDCAIASWRARLNSEGSGACGSI